MLAPEDLAVGHFEILELVSAAGYFTDREAMIPLVHGAIVWPKVAHAP